MRFPEGRQRRLASLAEYRQQRQDYKKEQEHSKRAREAKEADRFYDKRTERTYELGERIPAADPNASVSCGGKRKADVAEDNTHQHKKLKTNTLEMSPSRETKEHLEGIKVRRGEGQPYQGTARPDGSRGALEEKPKNPYAALKAAKRKSTSKAAADASIFYPLQAMVADIGPKPLKIRVPRIAGRSIEGRQDASKNGTGAKQTTTAKEAATPSRKRKAAEDLEEVSAVVGDVAKEATSIIYKKKKMEYEAKVEAAADTKPGESEAKVASGKKRKAADALEDDTAQAVVYGDSAPSAKKRRGEDWPIVKTGPLEEKKTVPSGEKKAKKSKDDEVFDPQNVHPGLAHIHL
ncbi:hypothetical protein JMJ35_000739 [Cladonia borealis]|uniref:Uncharacterized protein n=1 Tax=Cladonia borealis TaxID=184061 RepID=A0AA39R8P7_9LECA|nr:hypothetical protein JMJ35_000739 [Cladonia borealis]